MPKRAKKRAGGAKRGVAEREAAGSESDTDTLNTEDNASMLSDASYMKDNELNAGGGDDDDDQNQDELFEIRLCELVDLAEQKSSYGRAEALKAIAKAFSNKMVPSFANSNHETISYIVRKALRKGNAEQVQAANLALALCIQLGGSGHDLEELYNNLGQFFKIVTNDQSVALQSRIACIQAMGTLCFLAAPDIVEVKSVMDSFATIFQTYSKCCNQSLSLCTAALSAWTLLVTLLSRQDVERILVSRGNVFEEMLESSDVDLKITTAEAIAVLYEYVPVSEYSEDSDDDLERTELDVVMEALVKKLENLSTGTHKGTSKKDKKSQKSSVREILSTVNDEEDFYEAVKINSKEKLELTSWAHKIQHHALRKALGSGTVTHLSQNEFVRKIFELGPPLPSPSKRPVDKASKCERQAVIKESTKNRHAILRKNRDKRSAVI